MATALEIISDSLADIGAIDPLEPITADEAAHGLRKLNELLESLSNESLAVYQILQEGFATVAGTGSYTIGSGATWNTTRPLRIESAFLRDSSSNDTPLDVLDREEYDAIPLKTTRYRPEELFYYAAVPNGTVILNGVPDAVYTVYINSLKALQSFTALTDVVVLPPGYLRAIKSNLAIDLCPAYHKTPSALLVAIAAQSKAAIKRINARTPKMSVAHVAFQSEGRSGFNITIGD
ncbi:MAG: hypothetical protein ACREWG_06725 [Gammaproteobacteria bacterium]